MSMEQLEDQFRDSLVLSGHTANAPNKKKKSNNRNRKRKPTGEDRYFGRFSCKLCKKMWESSHVYTVAGTMIVKYKQRCKNCSSDAAWTFPYDLQMITCSICGVQSDQCRCQCDDCGRLWYRPRDASQRQPGNVYCTCRRERRNVLGEKIDEKKPHEKALCERCKTGRSCWGMPNYDDSAPVSLYDD